MDNTAIVVGATGLIGRALVEGLANAAHVGRVVTLTRRPAPHPSAKVANRVVDFDHLEDHADAFQGGWLFSALGTTRRQAGSIAAQRRADVDCQFRAARMAAGNGVPHYLLVSASGADDQSRNPYLKMKGDLEGMVQDLPFRRISIFQPSLLLGPREAFRLGETLGAWILPPLCQLPGLRRYRPIQGAQVAAKMIQVSLQPGQGVEWFRLDEIFPD